MAKAGKTNKPTKKSSTKIKKSTPRKKQINKIVPQETFFQSIYSRLKLEESYASLFLGALVVVILFILFFIFIGSREMVNKIETNLTPTASPVKNTQAPKEQKTYVIQEGEGLWDVAVKFYGDGFRWVDIAKANGMDPNELDYVNPGTKLIIPK